jgi:hypothetical protein
LTLPRRRGDAHGTPPNEEKKVPKPVARLSPGEIEALPWRPVVGAPDGVEERVLARDEETGAFTRFLRAPAGAELTPEDAGLLEETYVLGGTLHVDGRALERGGYVCRRPGDAAQRWSASEGFVALQCLEHASIAKPSAVMTADEVEALPWVDEDEYVKTRRLSTGACGSDTSFYWISATSPEEADQRHECTEEVLYLEGLCHEIDEPNEPGMYTCFPPQTVHGPYTFQRDLRIIEFKNYVAMT